MTRNVKKKRVQFDVHAEPDADVFVAGSFNDWNPKKNKLRPKNGGYSTNILLPKGTYEYKFVVNGSWLNDPQCDTQKTNEYGSVNSVVSVQ
ncbi:MAG: hypothetical protein GF401_06005 [Chitinivibrionales bacterium]|nr:hypothetical protein [Chitinivibrionales bacterium]